ncbi:MAG: DUF4249 domain-containing protein [Bacteroidota bacterium]
MRIPITLLTILLASACDQLALGVEDVVTVELPDARNQITVEGWLTNTNQTQYIKLTRSSSFNSPEPVEAIEDATILVQARTGQTFPYTYDMEGIYLSDSAFAADSEAEYRVRIFLSDGQEIRSDFLATPEEVPLLRLFIGSFEENDPDLDDPITVFFPRIVAIDPVDVSNHYRWRFFKNGSPFTTPESITILDDRFFDGNLIPNNFRSFGYNRGDKMTVEFESISANAYDYLSLLSSQITSLGTSSGTTPARIPGNLKYVPSIDGQEIFGFFGIVSVSSDTLTVE